MIKISGTNDDLTAAQGTTLPFVYLDHWAMRKISTNSVLSEKFRRSILDFEGTLAISWLNFLELSEVTDNTQLDAVGSFLDGIFPNICFVDVEPEKVIERENQMLMGQQTDPHLDNKLLKRFFRVNKLSLRTPSFSNFVRAIRKDQGQLAQMSRTFLINLTPTLQKARDLVKPNQSFSARAKKIPLGPNFVWATRYIYAETLLSLIRDDMPMDSNHWRDLYHMVIPLAYCNLILLDSAWVARANMVKERLRKNGYTAEMAQVFCQATLDKFWDAFKVINVQTK